MAHEIINAFAQGKQIRLRTAKPQYHFHLADGKFIGLSDEPFDKLVIELMLFPEKFELYQEPKKAWIESEEFENQVDSIDRGIFKGQKVAIVLAREFLKRYLERTYDFKNSLAYKTLCELVGESNL